MLVKVSPSHSNRCRTCVERRPARPQVRQAARSFPPGFELRRTSRCHRGLRRLQPGRRARLRGTPAPAGCLCRCFLHWGYLVPCQRSKRILEPFRARVSAGRHSAARSQGSIKNRLDGLVVAVGLDKHVTDLGQAGNGDRMTADELKRVRSRVEKTSCGNRAGAR